jgi:hypothetical protein
MATRRIDLQPTDANVIATLYKNEIGRQADLRAFIELLDSREGNWSFFIDGKWGDGKTFFVKGVSLLLKHFNSHLNFCIKEDGGTSIDLLFAAPHKDYFPVYYNAWHNDWDEDPVLSLILNLVLDYEELTDMEKIPADAQERITAVVDLLKPLLPFQTGSLSSALEQIKPEDLVKELRKSRENQQRLVEMLSALITKQGDRLVLFIDELDRCKPSFALKFLEQIKFLFDIEEMILVFATNTTELAKTVEGYYGPGFNGQGYLSRFYDERVFLSPVEPQGYLRLLGYESSLNDFDMIEKSIAKSIGFTMRELNRYHQAIETVRFIALKDLPLNDCRDKLGGAVLAFAISSFIPVLIAIRIKNNSEFEAVFSGSDEGKKVFESLAESCTPFQKRLQQVLERQRDLLGEITEGDYDPSQFFGDVYDSIFSSGPFASADTSDFLKNRLRGLLSIRANK